MTTPRSSSLGQSPFKSRSNSFKLSVIQAQKRPLGEQTWSLKWACLPVQRRSLKPAVILWPAAAVLAWTPTTVTHAATPGATAKFGRRTQ
jgi:hypothetical protein